MSGSKVRCTNLPFSHMKARASLPPQNGGKPMRWMAAVVASVLAGCASPGPAPDPSWLAAQEQRRAGTSVTPTPLTRAERDAVTRNEAMRAARNGQPLAPIVQRHAEENVRDGVAPTPLGRHSPAQVLHFEKLRLMDLTTNAIASMNAGNMATDAAAIEQRSRDIYCRSLAAEIDIAGSNTSDITLRMLGMSSPRENSLYRSCMRSFERVNDYLSR